MVKGIGRVPPGKGGHPHLNLLILKENLALGGWGIGG